MALSNQFLSELASAFGIATEFWDWKGRLTEVTDETVIAILAGMDVDAADPDKARAALEAHLQRPWTRLLQPCVVMEQGTPRRVHVHLPDGQWVRLAVRLEEGGWQDVPQVEDEEPARWIDGVLVGQAVVPAARRPAARLPPAAGDHGSRPGRIDAGGEPGVPRLPRIDGGQAGLGLRRPAVQRRVRRLLGDRRPARPRRPRHLVLHPAVRQLRAGQPAARRRAGAAAGTVPVPAELAALREPALHPAGTGAGVRRPRRPCPRPDRAAEGQAEEGALRRAADQARPGLDGEDRGAAGHLRPRPAPGTADGVQRLPAQGGTRPHPVRHLVGAGEPLRLQLAGMAGGAAAPVLADGVAVRGAARRRRSSSTPGCSGSPTTSCAQPSPPPRTPACGSAS